MNAREYYPESLFSIEQIQRPVLRPVSILIPTLGRELLASTLEFILLGTHWPHIVHIVDQGHKQDVKRYVAHAQNLGLNINHILSEKKGRAAGLNEGLSQIDTKFVTVTDDDCLVDENWLFLMMKRLEANPGSIITGRVEAEEGEVSLSTITDLSERVYHKPMLKSDPLFGGNMGLSMEIVNRIGPFDESDALRSAEDNDFGYRALKLGIPIRYSPEVTLLHLSWRDESQRTKRYRSYVLSQGGFYGKYIRQADGFMVYRAMRDQLRGPVRWVKGRFQGDFDDVASGRALTLYLVRGILNGLRGI